MANIPFRIDDERHRKLKMRAFDYKMSMTDYLREILDMSFQFSDEEFFEFIKLNLNGFESHYKESDVKKILIEKLEDLNLTDSAINRIMDALKETTIIKREEQS